MNPKKRIIFAGIFSAIVCVSVYAALPAGGPAESWTISKITGLTQSTVARIAGFSSSFGSSLEYKFENLISAIAIATKQEALSGNVTADSINQSAARQLDAYKAQQYNTDLVRVIVDYGGATGQGFDPCGTLARNRTLDAAFNEIPQRAQRTIASLDVAPGKMSDPVEVELDRLSEHRDKFCTQAEADAGLCKLSELPGADTNAAMLFVPAREGSPASDARRSYIQHVLGAPSAAISPKAGKTVSGQSYFFNMNHRESLRSIPAYSLAWIDAANTQSEEYGGRSPNEILTARINQYFGGAEALEWSKALSRQTDRGLLVEANKMAGLRAWTSHLRYQQNQRLEANLAALLVIASEEVKKKAVAESYAASVGVLSNAGGQ